MPAATLVQQQKQVADGALYQPRGAALELFYNRSREVLMDGPAGTGKSRAILEKGNALAWKYAGCRGLIARKTRTSLTQTGMVTFEKKVQPVGTPVRFNTSDQEYRYPNGSVIVVGGLDKASRIMSTEYDFVIVLEATELTENDWESLVTRLRNGVVPYQQIIADCNPSYPKHWLNQRCLAGRTERLLSRHEDNPAVTREYLETLEQLTGVRYLRLRRGVWAAADGLVYPEFDASVHVIDRFTIPKSWTRYRVIDFGFVHPFCCQWWAENPDGVLYMYRELYGTHRIVEDWAREIKRLSESEFISATITDHDAEDRATLEEHLNCTTVAARKEVSPGIQAVRARLVGSSANNGKPRLFYLRDSLVSRDPLLEDKKNPASTVEEYDSYIWETGTGGAEKERPVKKFDEGVDCTRYLAMHLDGAEDVNAKPVFNRVFMPVVGGVRPNFNPYGLSKQTMR